MQIIKYELNGDQIEVIDVPTIDLTDFKGMSAGFLCVGGSYLTDEVSKRVINAVAINEVLVMQNLE